MSFVHLPSAYVLRSTVSVDPRSEVLGPTYFVLCPWFYVLHTMSLVPGLWTQVLGFQVSCVGPVSQVLVPGPRPSSTFRYKILVLFLRPRSLVLRPMS